MLRRNWGGAWLLVMGLSACGGEDNVSFGSSTGGAGTGGASTGGSGGGGTGGGVTGGSGGTVTGGAGGSVSGGAGGTTGGAGGSGGATGGAGGSGGTTTGGSGGAVTGGTGGSVTGGSGGSVTGGAGGSGGSVTGGAGGSGGTVTGGAGGTGGSGGTVTGGTGGTGGGCTSNPQCNDNDACTNDVCSAGSCVHTKVDPNDNDACTIDLCDPTTGVSHVGEKVLFEEDFSDNSAGWALGTEWEIKPASASNGAPMGANDPASDHSPSSDNGVAGTVIGGFPSKTVHGFYYLESPAIDTTKATPGSYVELRFWRWLNSDYNPYMRSRIEVWDGTQWVVLWSTQSQSPPQFLIDAPPRGMGWYPMSFDVSAYKNAQFKLRFGFDVGNAQVFSVGGWTVDDLSIVASPVKTDADQCTVMTCNTASGAQFSPLPAADNDPCTIDTCSTYGGLSHVPKSRRFFEDFSDNNAGWTLGTQWQIGSAQSSSCGSSSCGGNDPSSDHTSTNDNGVAGVVIGGCTGTAQHGDYCLTSPSINLMSETASVSLGYWRHLHADYGPYMVSHVDVSSNGGSSWTQIWSTGTAACINDASWTLQTFDVTSYKASNFRMRFCYSVPQSGAFDGGGFSVDDVSLYDPACLSP